MPRAKIKISNGEIHCKRCLDKLDYTSISQYRISALPRYRYDYYFKQGDRHYILEFDGRQHFQFTPWFHRSEKIFKSKQTRDFLKTVVAVVNGYYIIRVSHDDLWRLEDILIEAQESKKRYYFSNPLHYQYLTKRIVPKAWLTKYGSSYFT